MSMLLVIEEYAQKRIAPPTIMVNMRRRFSKSYQKITLKALKDFDESQIKSNVYCIYLLIISCAQISYSDFRFLGVGKQGLVLLAKNKSNNKRYAIKGNRVKNSQGAIHQETYNQTQIEIQQLEKCRGSPYVVNLLGTIEGKEFTYLILNECQGTLNEIIQNSQNQKLNELSVIKYAKDIAEGLLYIHSKKTIAKDIKYID